MVQIKVILYRLIDIGRPTKHESVKFFMSTYPSPGRNFTLLTSLANRNMIFKFLKDKNKDYLVSSFFLNCILEGDHVDTHVILESAMSYEAWVERAIGEQPKKKQWETAKQLLGVFGGLMESLVKVHEDEYKIHEWIVFVYRDEDKSRISSVFKYKDISVRSCKFSYLDVADAILGFELAVVTQI
ncbi:hypothetical protein OROHE_015932 [Orobanche hederae]